MYKTILIAVDIANSDKAESMIKFAKAQNSEAGEDIILHVVEELPTWATATLPSDFMSDSNQYALDKMNAIAQQSGGDVSVEVRSGNAYQTIIQVAEEKDVDLIMVASHKPGMQDYLLGSTAAKVVRHSKCSVLVDR